MLLNPLQRFFIERLLKKRVEFLVIGGQARHTLDGTPTSDLDLWVRFDRGKNLDRFCAVFNDWQEEFPNHCKPLHRNSKPDQFNSRTQVKIPDAEVPFRNPYSTEHEILKISEKDIVDVLFSVADLNFEDSMARSIETEINGVRSLSKEDYLESQKPRHSDDP